MNKIVGIDLGTTNSGVAVVQDGRPTMLPHQQERIIPSVVGYSPGGQWLVGTPARNQYILDPENTVRSIKRSMGTARRVALGGREFTPQEISAFILRELKGIAELHLDGDVTDAVITVPAYFSDAARQATRDAGEIAGFNVRRIINEPTAAALAYGLNQATDQLALVYDLGGGTFDVSLVELIDGIVEVRASHGDTQLGGDDFDERLAELLAGQFRDAHGIDLHAHRRAWARLQRAAEMAKITLSDQPFAWVREEYLAEQHGVPLHLEYEISRQAFENAITDLLARTIDCIDWVLDDAGVASDEITQVLMVGGSSRVPAVWETVANYVDIEPQMTLNPEEVVALGASVQAAIIAGDPIDAILVDVTPYSLGIAVAENHMGRVVTDRYKVLIHRNTTIPVTKADVFTTLYPDQDTIKIQVYQGESHIASENTPLGDFLITDLQPEFPDELAQVTVEFDMDVNGILQVSAQDRRTGNREAITVEASLKRLTEAQIVEARGQLEAYEPRLATNAGTILELSEESAALLLRASTLLDAPDLDAANREALRQIVLDIQIARADRNAERLDVLLEALLDALFDLEA
jgi:molecular chaperone DnaK